MLRGLDGKVYEWLKLVDLFSLVEEETEDRPHCITTSS